MNGPGSSAPSCWWRRCCWAAHGMTRSSTALAAPTYQDVTVTDGPVQQTVSASGSLQPAQQANLSFASSATVTAVPVAVGQTSPHGPAWEASLASPSFRWADLEHRPERERTQPARGPSAQSRTR